MGKSLRDWQEEYQYFSTKASEATKSLAFGGLAIIWLFKVEDQDILGLVNQFGWPITFLTASLAFDLLHYVVGAIIWYRFYVDHEKSTPKDQYNEIEAPNWKRDIVTGLFNLKIALLIVAYVLLLISIIKHL